MEVSLLGCIDNIEVIIAASARATRTKPVSELIDEMKLEEARRFIGRLMAQGHEGVSEFAFYIFAVKGVSRILTHQLVRHRIASYLQMSSRHCDLGNSEYIIPQKIKVKEETNILYTTTMENTKKDYIKLTENDISLEDARFILPDSIETHIVVGMNARSLNNFFGHRLCGKAQWEIRELAGKMRNIVYGKNPSLFWAEHRPCVIRGVCPQKPSCGFSETEEYKKERVRYLNGYPNE